MEFALTSEQLMIGELAGQLFAEHATSARTRAAMAAGGIDHALWSAFADAGLAGTAVPEAHGGTGLGLVEMAVVAEAAGRHVAAAPVISGAIVSAGLMAGGTVAQQNRWLPRLASGAIGTVAEADGEVAPRAPHGAVAELVLVERGDALLLAQEFAVEPQTSMDQTRPLDRLCLGAGETLADSAAAVGAMRRWGWTLIGADSLGGAEACLARTVQYAKERTQFGHPIGTFQAVKHALADVAVAVEQARSAVYWAAAEPADSTDVLLAAHAAKAVACEAYVQAAAAMIQLHGGIGFTWEHDAHLFFKRAQANRSWMGTPDWHFDRIAELILPRAA